jgi:hypothetical protein
MIRKEDMMQIIIHLKYGGCCVHDFDDRDEMLKHFEHLQNINYSKSGKYISNNTIIPHNNIAFIEIQGHNNGEG